MSKTAVKKEKKKWSTGKKVAVILCSVLLALILIVVSGGLIYLHNYCQVKDYTVTAMGNHDVTLIAHRGFRAVAPENTLPAFEEAGKAGFTGAECDTYRTKDGVWVISHDSHTYRMMDQHAFVEKKTYDELLTYNTDNGVNIDQYPNLKICTLEDYLKTCVQYNMTAVIELKGKNNTEHYDEIMKLVADTGASRCLSPSIWRICSRSASCPRMCRCGIWYRRSTTRPLQTPRLWAESAALTLTATRTKTPRKWCKSAWMPGWKWAPGPLTIWTRCKA